VVSSFVAPIANDPSRIAFGTEFIASSEREAIIGIIITPMTIPGLKIFVASTSGQTERISGVTKVKAKNPYTMVGIPARTSNDDFKTLLTLSEAYTRKQIADIKPIGPAISMAILMEIIVPFINGSTPN